MTQLIPNAYSPNVLDTINSHTPIPQHPFTTLSKVESRRGTIFVFPDHSVVTILHARYLPALLATETVLLRGSKSVPTRDGYFTFKDHVFTRIKFAGDWVIYE